ncbi:cysteine-rich motor neuron 1 protein [Alosa sapidissima]|uniref:cysteine-rich motor neuron 1 protein n=1 Tax=Alosa sapidissima TaxID=34773 RepID=UPI001C07FAED|nr:cysteine-rich motor neuron 1 protein [Alosa sapidissima]
MILIAKNSRALLCLPCDESKCEEPKQCKGAVVPGICGCCTVCAKQKNESCGGMYGLYGTCDRGLRCVIRPLVNGGFITQFEVGVCEDENWDDDQLLGFEPCNENLVTGCNIIDGKCECDSLRTCNNPFEFPSQDTCQTALKKIEGRGSGVLRQCTHPVLHRRSAATATAPIGISTLTISTLTISTLTSTSTTAAVARVDSVQRGLHNSGVSPPYSRCSVHPTATRTQVRLTADGCCTLPTRCECLPGQCSLPQCPAGTSPQVVSHGDSTPGRCCDVLECVNETKPACTFNGIEYQDGDMFRMDACRFCRCQGGVSVCFTAQCGILHCERYYVPEGECCPVCEDPIYPVLNFAGCYVNGQILAHGDHWREDDCTFCQCVSGDARCVAAACGHSCLHPVTVPGECCPVCEEPSYITMAPPACGRLKNCSLTELDCLFGFRLDASGCRTCHCKTREELCSGLIASCTLKCPFGFQTDAHGCAVCQCRPRPKKCKAVACEKECPFGFIKNKHGCDLCRCKKCPELPCDKSCPMGFQQDQLGCLICQCRDQTVSSVAPSVKLGSCLSMDGRRHENGENWHDGCRDCYCHNGREMCALISCPVPTCESPTIRPGQCCPSCPDEPSSHKPVLSDSSVCLAPGGEYFVEGETWNIDSCTQCTCHSGRVLCETEVCPPLLCQNPIRSQDSCCPHCPEEPVTPQSPSNDSMPSYCRNEEGDIFLAAESWKPNMCSSCVCLDGTISCFSETCPPVACARPVLRKGQCCPYCLDATPKAVCHFNGKTYMDEERWDIDSCTHCYCLQGQTLCSTVSCPALPCHQPIIVEGSCCPMCPEMYAPTNVPIEKTDQKDKIPHQPAWPTHSENDIMPQFRGDFGSLQMPYLDGKAPLAREERTLQSVAWVALPVAMMLLVIAALLLLNQKKQWIPVPCYRTPTKPTCLNNQLVYVDCQKGTKVQVDSAQRMLRMADPDSRYSGYYSMQKHNNLQADNFYQTA